MYYFSKEDLYLPTYPAILEATSSHREVSCLEEAVVWIELCLHCVNNYISRPRPVRPGPGVQSTEINEALCSGWAQRQKHHFNETS